MLSVAIKPVCAEVFFTNNENKLECLLRSKLLLGAMSIKKTLYMMAFKQWHSLILLGVILMSVILLRVVLVLMAFNQ
jgi:hypothetical protein